jgi:tetratricopeptide (TPR) repeat protein
MSKSESADWQDVERRGTTLIDKGHQFQQLGCDEDALASFDKAVTICRNTAEAPEPIKLICAQALDNKARALMDLKRLDEALPCFDEAIQVHEGIVRGDGTGQDVREIAVSVMNKGLVLMRLGRNTEALACFERAIDCFEQCQSGEDYARAWLNCGELYARQNRFDQAVAAFDESAAAWEAATAFKPDAAKADYAYTLFSKADVLRHIRRYHEALELCDRSIAIHRTVVSRANGPRQRKDLAEALNLRGHILTDLGHTKEAQECFREAARLRGGTDRSE